MKDFLGNACFLLFLTGLCFFLGELFDPHFQGAVHYELLSGSGVLAVFSVWGLARNLE
jgi:hypothetical protein